MRFGARAGAISAIEVGTSVDVLDGLFDVDEMEESHQRKSIQCTVQEASVLLSPFITSKRARLWVLQICYDYTP